MSLILQGRFEPVVAAWRWEGRKGERRVEMPNRLAARAWLMHLGAQAGEMERLRQLVGERRELPAVEMEDGEVIDQLATSVATGELRLWALTQGG